MSFAPPSDRPRLTRRQIRVLFSIARVHRATNGAACRTWLRKRDREIATSLWRRGLVEVWYQQSAFIECSLIGAFYCLSRRGEKLVDILLSTPPPTKEKTMQARKFDPTEGQAFQGDVAIIPVPAGIAVARLDEIKPMNGRLILQEGERTGHHHAVEVRPERRFKPDRPVADPILTTRSPRLRRAFGAGKIKAADLARAIERSATAKLFRDAAAAEKMASLPVRAPDGSEVPVLTRTDLCIGFLVVEGEPLAVSHDEHDSIEIPAGLYCVGRQIESAGAEERVVSD